MIVDPETGQPIDANTVGGEAGIRAMQASGLDTPVAVDVLASMPSALHSTMWNMGRTSRTMTRGGRRGAAGARGIRQTFSPLAMGRLQSVGNIDPMPGSRTYTPFNFLAHRGNKLASRAANSSTGIGRYIAGHLGPAGTNGEWFSAGTGGRIAAMGRVFSASDKGLAKMAPNIEKAFKTLNPQGYSSSKVSWIREFSEPMGFKSGINLAGRNELSQMAGMSMRGSISQKAAGFVHASTMRKAGMDSISQVANLAQPGTNFYKGAAKALEWADGTGMRAMAARGARFVPMAARAAGPVGAILLARDVGAMTGKILAHAGKTAIDAGNSIKGSLDKPIMGMGFRDNMVASTSRARGVMAIQNSRLNMRSALGNEAAGIHAAWG